MSLTVCASCRHQVHHCFAAAGDDAAGGALPAPAGGDAACAPATSGAVCAPAADSANGRKSARVELNACVAAASSRFFASVVTMLPVVCSSSSIKLMTPLSMVGTVHPGDQLSGRGRAGRVGRRRVNGGRGRARRRVRALCARAVCARGMACTHLGATHSSKGKGSYPFRTFQRV